MEPTTTVLLHWIKPQIHLDSASVRCSCFYIHFHMQIVAFQLRANSSSGVCSSASPEGSSTRSRTVSGIQHKTILENFKFSGWHSDWTDMRLNFCCNLYLTELAYGLLKRILKCGILLGRNWYYGWWFMNAYVGNQKLTQCWSANGFGAVILAVRERCPWSHANRCDQNNRRRGEHETISRQLHLSQLPLQQMCLLLLWL